jgi:lactoylglutathione lyase
MIKNDHMAFQVSNMDASIRFYTGALGLKLLFRHVNEEVREDYAFLELDGGNLELLQYLGAPFVKPEIKPPYCPHLALATDDMDETLRLFTEHGIPVVKGPLENPGEERWVYVSDPDNNIIEYIQWLAGK